MSYSRFKHRDLWCSGGYAAVVQIKRLNRDIFQSDMPIESLPFILLHFLR